MVNFPLKIQERVNYLIFLFFIWIFFITFTDAILFIAIYTGKSFPWVEIFHRLGSRTAVLNKIWVVWIKRLNFQKWANAKENKRKNFKGRKLGENLQISTGNLPNFHNFLVFFTFFSTFLQFSSDTFPHTQIFCQCCAYRNDKDDSIRNSPIMT